MPARLSLPMSVPFRRVSGVPTAPARRFALPAALRRHPPVLRPLARIGALEVRLAASPAEMRRAQRLRYAVFFREGGAEASAVARLFRRDADRFDPACRHLMVVDHATRDALGRPRLVATTRVLTQEAALRLGGFYSADEFDLAPLLARHPQKRFLEVGRSCVAASHRSRLCVDLIWRGLATLAEQDGADVLIGCASLPGTDSESLAVPLAFLYHWALGQGDWAATARPERTVPMDRLPAAAVDARKALRDLPPLLRGYVRLGAHIGAGAVVDTAFGTTDVLVVLPIADVGARYRARFGGDALAA